MENFESPEPFLFKYLKVKVDNYKGYDVFINNLVSREHVATMMPNGAGIAIAIAINPDAYEILKSRPDYLARIYDHELQENTTIEGVEHGNDNDVLEFLKDNGYDFGDFKFEKN